MSTFTANLNLEQVARGADVGVWDTPTNSNWGITDSVVGGTATIGLNNSNVILNAAQFQSANLTFNSTLTGSVAITFPSTFTKSYTVRNLCTGSSAFTITLQTTASGQVILCPPGQSFEAWNDGTNLYFHNFGPPIGGYWDYAGSSVPGWVSGCTVPPYLNCDGTTFSAATYPQLNIILGSSVLPDFRGRSAAYLNQGTGRITSSQGGVDGNTLAAAGGGQTTTLSSQNVPPVPVTDPGHNHSYNFPSTTNVSGGAFPVFAGGGSSTVTSNNTTGITAGNAVPTAFSNLHPVAIAGLRLIRAG